MNQTTPTALRELRESESAARQRRDYHHQQFNRAFSKLKALGERCPGVTSPEVQAAGAALAKATRGDIQGPVMAFADALVEYARAGAGEDQEEDVVWLSQRAVDHMRDLEHHVNREAAAQRELQLFHHTLATSCQSLIFEKTPGRG